MATNKNALIRYRTIDKCLQNRQRKWTLENLIDACSDALEEYEGKATYVSKRTVQLDLQLMRSDKLGYEAPIEVYERKYYRYADPNYSITNIPLSGTDLDVLSESVEMLRQFSDFSLFTELNGVLQKLEDKIYRATDQRPPVIHLETNDRLKGLEHLDVLYQAILKKIVMCIEYRSFKAREARAYTISVYILKEFNNRWFLVGRARSQNRILTLALDRIVSVRPDPRAAYEDVGFDPEAYYRHTYGVTVFEDHPPVLVELWIDAKTTPYVVTKPFHASQKIVEEREDGSSVVSLCVHLNLEFARLLLGFGPALRVLSPGSFRRRILRLHRRAVENYENASL